MKSGEGDGGIDIVVDPKPAKNREGGHRSKGTVLKEKLERELANHEAKIWWNTFFIMSCGYAIFNDPFFCYIDAIDSANKCITTDSKLAHVYIYSRSVTDVIYLLDLLISKCRCCCCCSCRRRTRKRYQSCFPNLLSTLSRIYVCLPIAQILVHKMIGSLEPNSSNFLFFFLLQYTLRIYYIYGSLKRRSMINIAQVKRWIRPILGFVPFILAAYLFGAFWYLLATQRQIKCWLEKRDQITAKYNGTYVSVSSKDSSKGYVACYSHQPNITYPRRYNISRWDDLCPVKDSDPKNFDFGIYFYALQSDVASSSKPLLQRVFQSFWWALRNMSSFGSNLNSSMDTLEIFFSALISISGMALLLGYLNARVLQESKERSKKLLLEEKKQSMKSDIDLWLSKNNLPEDIETGVTDKKKKTTKKNLKTVIMDNIHKLDENSTALDMQNILSILPIKYKQRIMSFLFFASATKSPVFQTIYEKVLKAICQHLVPVTYTEDSYIVQEGKPLGKLLLFTQGSAFTYSHGGTSSTAAGFSSNKQLWLKKGDFYGDQLIHWAFRSPQNMVLPISTENVIAHETVEAFAIRASDLKTIFLQFWWLFSKDVHGSQLEQWEHVAAIATWRHRQQAKRRLEASCAKPKRWFRRHEKRKDWNGMKSDECDGGIAICVVDPKPAKKGEGGHRSKGTVLKEKLERELANHEAKIWWNTFFIISCAYAVFNDPFFCYMNAIDSINKCITTDKKLAIRYILSRSVTDVIYLLDLLISKCRCCCCCCCRRRTRKQRYQSCFPNLLSTLSRICVCLPIAQILVYKMIGSLEPNSSRNFLFFLSLQYTLRIYYIYGSLKRRSMMNIAQVETWIRPILGFVPFILAAHLFGAFWYLFATQKQIQCWLKNRDQITAENIGTYVSVACYARQPNITYNISRWDDLCPVKDSDPKTFDFGIYFYALQSDVASSSKPLPQRVFQSFWWALRNMSSFGSNLNSSMDTLEIYFSALISISGMALFLVYLQESKDRSKKLLLEEKKQSMKSDIDLWLSKNNLPEDIKPGVLTEKKKKNLKTVIMDNIHKLDENSTALDMQNILSILPTKYKQRIMSFLFFASATKSPVFQTIYEKVLKAICQHLVPVTYTEDSYIVQEGKPLGKLLLFTQGSAFIYSHGGTSSTAAGSSSNKQLWLKKGDFYGDQLIHWAFRSPQNMVLPISTENVVAQEKVEAFAIRASDLKTIFLQFWWLFSKDVHGSQLEQWKHVAATSIATWRHRQQAKRRLEASRAKPKRWFRRHVNTKGWSGFDVWVEVVNVFSSFRLLCCVD